jgi:hypothetical protein
MTAATTMSSPAAMSSSSTAAARPISPSDRPATKNESRRRRANRPCFFRRLPRAAARAGEQKADNTTVLHDAVYSPCNLCPKIPPSRLCGNYAPKKSCMTVTTRIFITMARRWRSKAKPVAYIPYFSHPDPSVVSRSGLLTPQFSTIAKKALCCEITTTRTFRRRKMPRLEFSDDAKSGTSFRWRMAQAL